MLFDSDNLCLGLFFITTIDDGDNGLCEVNEGLACHGVDFQGSGLTSIAALTDTLYDGDLGQQGYTHLLCQILAAFFSEDVIAVLGQFCRSEPCHVLDEAEDRHVDLLVPLDECSPWFEWHVLDL